MSARKKRLIEQARKKGKWARKPFDRSIQSKMSSSNAILAHHLAHFYWFNRSQSKAFMAFSWYNCSLLINVVTVVGQPI